MSKPVKQQVVLVVDDTPDNIDVLNGVLSPHYKVKAALNGEKALKIAAGMPQPDIILLDIMMPEMDGYQVCARLKADPLTAAIPVIFITAKGETADEAKGLGLGAADYITKPIRPAIVLARVKTHLDLYDQHLLLERKVRERTEQLNQTRLQVIQRLGRAAEYKDNETGLHVIRMSHYTRLLALSAGLDEAYAELLFNAAPMHDIGKIGIPDAILTKPGKLDAEEWKIMRQHPGIGAGIIGMQDNELLETARVVALTHHEKWNGTGYPRGLAGEDIPLPGRIVAVADVFDALTSERPYKKAWPVEQAVDLLKEESGEHFDPKLVEAFLAVLPQVLEVQQKYMETFPENAAAG